MGFFVTVSNILNNGLRESEALRSKLWGIRTEASEWLKLCLKTHLK